MIQTGWVTAHLDDLASDFSAIHRVDMYSLPGPAFFRAAFRLAAYEGVMRSVVMEAVTEDQNTSGGTAPSPAAGRGRDVIPATKAAIQAHPELAGIISFS